MIYIGCFWSLGKVLFLAGIIAGRGSALMCDCVARAIFGRAPWESGLVICLLLHFSSGHPEAFGMCFGDRLEGIVGPEFWDGPWSFFYSILKILDLVI